VLFDSYLFIFCFLPITLLGFFLLTKYTKSAIAISWLVLASLFFYAWWNPKYLLLLLLSISVNYVLGNLLWKKNQRGEAVDFLLYAGIGLNLCFLGYFKYSDFLVSNINNIFSTSIVFEALILPLGISFFTFQKIAFLVDASRGDIKQYRFLDYCLFVSFFPQLIAGPIVQHKQFIPQIENQQKIRITARTLSVGLTLFFIGLLKKIGLADGVAEFANAVFDGAAKGISLSFWEAWGGAAAYALQLYFDFSGYSDMAIGLAYLFGIKLPLNFFSPYKAINIIDFWRRWHVTLSTFLRNYLYIPLGGNQKGATRRYINLVITMLLGGLWHGANWTFVLWGAMHGFYLTVNHFWRKLTASYAVFALFKKQWFRYPSHLLTLLAVITAWVPFRAADIQVTQSILHSMYSLTHFSLPHRLLAKCNQLEQYLISHGIEKKGMFYNELALWSKGVLWIAALIAIALLVPNTMQMMTRYLNEEKKSTMPLNNTWLRFAPTTIWAAIMAFIFLFTFMLLSEESEFLYFQF